MAAKNNVRVRLNIRGINKVMRDDAMQKKTNEIAARMKNRAGDGHVMVPSRHRWVARSYVQQKDAAQARKDPNGMELLRAMGEVSDG